MSKYRVAEQVYQPVGAYEDCPCEWIVFYEVQVKVLFFWVCVKSFRSDEDWRAKELLELLEEEL